MTLGLGIAWMVFVMVVMSNAAAAGIAALLYAWRITSRGRRSLVGSAVAGSLFAGLISGTAFIGANEGENLLVMLPAVFGVCFVVGTLVSMPAALIVSRKHEGPGYDHRVFE